MNTIYQTALYAALATSMDTICADESLVLYLRMKDYQLHPCAKIHATLLTQKVCRDFASSLKPPVEVNTEQYLRMSLCTCVRTWHLVVRQVFYAEEEKECSNRVHLSSAHVVYCCTGIPNPAVGCIPRRTEPCRPCTPYLRR